MTTTSTTFTGMAIAAALILAACANEPRPQAVPTAPATSDVVLQAPLNEVASEAQTPIAAQLNPAHGEPGHRCEIPVGAPLDGSGQASTEVTMPPTVAPMVAPVTSPEGGSGMLNPAHGEPGHDCAVPVGSPLPG